MIRIFLAEKAEPLRPLILDLLLYNHINNITVEVSEEKKHRHSLHVDISKFDNLEDVMSEVAMLIRPLVKSTAKSNLPSQIWLDNKHGEDKAHAIVSIIETAIEPDTFFALERYRL